MNSTNIGDHGVNELTLSYVDEMCMMMDNFINFQRIWMTFIDDLHPMFLLGEFFHLAKTNLINEKKLWYLGKIFTVFRN